MITSEEIRKDYNSLRKLWNRFKGSKRLIANYEVMIESLQVCAQVTYPLAKKITKVQEKYKDFINPDYTVETEAYLKRIYNFYFTFNMIEEQPNVELWDEKISDWRKVQAIEYLAIIDKLNEQRQTA